MENDPDRFRKPAPVINLTPEVLAELQRLLDDAQTHASLTGLPWRREASSGKPLLYGGEKGRGALMAYGTIGSWNEIDLAVAAVNALPALLQATRPTADLGEDGELVEIAAWLRERGRHPWADRVGQARDRLILYREALERVCAKIDDAVPYGCCDEELVAIRALLSRSGDD